MVNPNSVTTSSESTTLPSEPIAPPSAGPATALPKPYLTIRPTSGWIGVNLGDLWRFRDLLMQLALRDLKLRYKQTALGVIWVVLQPLMAAGIFTFVFGLVAKLPADGLPHFIFSFVGLLGWNLFAGTVGKISGSLVSNAHLISKVYFPRLILPLSNVPSVLVDFGVALAMCAILMAIYKIAPGWPLLLLPVWIATLLALAVGLGLITSSLSVRYRDVNYILPVFLQMAMYASPIAYGVSAVPEKWRTIYYLNPLAGVLEAIRWSLIGGTAPSPIGLCVTIAGAALLMLAGLLLFKRMEREFADVV